MTGGSFELIVVLKLPDLGRETASDVDVVKMVKTSQ